MIAIAGRRPLGWITFKDRTRLANDEVTMGVRIAQEAFGSDDVAVFDVRPSIDEAGLRSFLAGVLEGRLMDPASLDDVAGAIARGILEGAGSVATDDPVLTGPETSMAGEALRPLTLGELAVRLTEVSDWLEGSRDGQGRVVVAERPAAAASIRIRQAVALLTGRGPADV